MTEQLITEIQRKMLPYLNNEQLMHLRDAMAETLEGATITYDSGSIPADEADAVEAFITAKRIEGCSEKTLSYYRKTIEALIAGVGKAVRQITTDDLRRYLTNYQVQRRSSKVTIDNIRRILSSFFSWLEDEDFIVKSPVRRIHKVKTLMMMLRRFSVLQNPCFRRYLTTTSKTCDFQHYGIHCYLSSCPARLMSPPSNSKPLNYRLPDLEVVPCLIKFRRA